MVVVGAFPVESVVAAKAPDLVASFCTDQAAALTLIIATRTSDLGSPPSQLMPQSGRQEGGPRLHFDAQPGSWLRLSLGDWLFVTRRGLTTLAKLLIDLGLNCPFVRPVGTIRPAN